MNFTRSILFLLCCSATFFAGCLSSADNDHEERVAETYYLDAPNGFALEYPATWKRERKTAASIVWRPPETGADVLVTVTSYSPLEVRGGDDRMLADFIRGRPGFAVETRGETVTEAGQHALRVEGYTRDRRIIALFVTTRRRAFVLEFSAPPSFFGDYRPVFLKMANSFRALP